jgi:Flp pilus assembly protein CpaB
MAARIGSYELAAPATSRHILAQLVESVMAVVMLAAKAIGAQDRKPGFHEVLRKGVVLVAVRNVSAGKNLGDNFVTKEEVGGHWGHKATSP